MPASAQSTPLPTEKTRDCTAPPTSPVAGSKLRIEKVATGSQGRDDFDLSCALEKTTKIRTTAINKNSLLCIGEPPIIDLTTKAQRTQRRINHVVFLCVLCAFVVKKSTQAFDRDEHVFEIARGVKHRCRLKSAVHHAVLTLRVTAVMAIFLPLGRCKQLLERLRVAVIEQVTGLLPTQHAEVRIAPRRTIVIQFAHQKFEVER